MAEPKAIMLYRDYKYFFDGLTDEEAGALIKALFYYDEEEKADPFISDDWEQLTPYYRFMCKRIDADKKAFDEKCRKNAENARKRWGGSEEDTS